MVAMDMIVVPAAATAVIVVSLSSTNSVYPIPGFVIAILTI